MGPDVADLETHKGVLLLPSIGVETEYELTAARIAHEGHKRTDLWSGFIYADWWRDFPSGEFNRKR